MGLGGHCISTVGLGSSIPSTKNWRRGEGEQGKENWEEREGKEISALGDPELCSKAVSKLTTAGEMAQVAALPEIMSSIHNQS